MLDSMREAREETVEEEKVVVVVKGAAEETGVGALWALLWTWGLLWLAKPWSASKS